MSADESLEVQFRRRFVISAGPRMSRISEAIESRDTERVSAGFHELAGDAFLLRWDAFGSQAAEGERGAIGWGEGREGGEAACKNALEMMRCLLDRESSGA